MTTLWDLLKPIREILRPKPPAVSPPAASVPAAPPPPTPTALPEAVRPALAPVLDVAAKRRKAGVGEVSSPSMQERYDAMVREMLGKYGIKVRKWRKNSSGIARLTTFRNGTTLRTLEAPRPTGPMSAAIFLHEIGHHAIGFDTYKPRCLEEYHAWAFAIREMERLGLNVTESVRYRMHRSLKYAIDKARRRGLKELPPELQAFDCPPRKPERARKPGRAG